MNPDIGLKIVLYHKSIYM